MIKEKIHLRMGEDVRTVSINWDCPVKPEIWPLSLCHHCIVIEICNGDTIMKKRSICAFCITFLNWSIVVFQMYSKVNQLYMHTHTHTHIFFFMFFSLIGYYKILSIVPCAILSVLSDYFLHSSASQLLRTYLEY